MITKAVPPIERAVKTPFDEWWPKVQSHFPNVPKNVAKQWLHRHWGHSPYCWLCSKNYRFTLVDWDSENLSEIKSESCDWGYDGCLKHGEYLINDCDFWLKNYMLKHGAYPEPIIVLDNRDSHLIRGKDNVPAYEDIPKGYVLIEGHLRFNASLYLFQTGRFNPMSKIWLMERI